MMVLLLLEVVSPQLPVFGGMYPSGVLIRPTEHNFCATRYTLSTPDTIDQVAMFYRDEAVRDNVPLLDDSAAKFADYRTLVFVRQPKFLSVSLTRKEGQTQVRVSFHVLAGKGC